MKTLEFLQWLGVDVPRWIANDLRHADDALDASYDQAVATGESTSAGIPIPDAPWTVPFRQRALAI
jgi:hypothetical protein